MTNWQPLSVRSGLRPSLPPEDVPKRVQDRLVAWLEHLFNYHTAWIYLPSARNDAMLRIAAAAGLDPLPKYLGNETQAAIIAAAIADSHTMLDVLDASLYSADTEHQKLELDLQLGGSAWTVRKDGRGLERRVDPATADAYKAASSPDDAASAELNEAWRRAYGLDPDASDAWDHAIKAVEAVLIPIVTENNEKATLGTVLAALRDAPEKLTFHLTSSSHAVSNIQTVEAMLRLIWPNPDRHGGVGGTRAPSLQEAQSVLQIAIAIVHFVRLGTLS